jgi:hypothetical protein
LCASGAGDGSAAAQPAVGFSLSFPDNAVNPKLRRTIADRVVATARQIAARTGDPAFLPAARHAEGVPARRVGS